MSASARPRLRLVTIGPSHYCEKARWALDRISARYEEEAHPPLLHWLATLGRRGGRTVPVLLTPHGLVKDSTAILRFLDSGLDAAQRLYPTDDAARREVEELEEHFDEKLGPATRRVIYFHLAQSPELFRDVFAHGLSGVERVLFLATYRAILKGIHRGLNVNADAAERSEKRAREIFDEVGSRLRDGRRYLVSDRLTAADLTFAALAAPVLRPDEYGVPLGQPSEATPTFVQLIESFRETAAGQFALRLYREERRTVVRRHA